ncbi:hypothetical protein ACAG26_20880 [Mycobacterium sp. pUA109]|uniref:hypothetical protein n=1 Tax=Mycobacterium sp. pUA109 TaxID=3238982 RepID=UPI00351BAEA8
MSRGDGASGDSPVIDPAATPQWRRTGYTYFPYAARQCGQWWVLRHNYGFPEHDMYTLFVDGQAAADMTGDQYNRVPLLTSIAALKPADPQSGEPTMDAATAESVVAAVARYADYGSEVGDPCIFCADDHDGMARD